MNIKQVTISDETITNSMAINLAFKRFAIKHGLSTDEVGRHESRTMNYKTNFPHKNRRIKEIKKRYGSPRKWVRWAREQQIQTAIRRYV
tara:strand:+ start:513 stop:779 length:267 start_codon:yes stop_codon:yes gene_type:complete